MAHVTLHAFIDAHCEEIIRRCKARETRDATTSLPLPATARLDHGVALFLDQLADALRLGVTSNGEIDRAALLHGHGLLMRGFTVGQIVHAYGDIGQSIADLAVETETFISADDFRTLNRCLSEAIASAVTQHASEQEAVRNAALALASERLGFMTHELRNLTNTALFAFDALKTGNAGVAGATGSALHRSLTGIGALIGRSLDEVRLTHGVQHREPFAVSRFVEELAPAATLEAVLTGVRLTLVPVDNEMMIVADRRVLEAVVENLLQNAIKFTRPHTTVTLRVTSSGERVLIEIEDQCGGVPGGNVTELFRPVEERSAERTGFGLGLPFCRWAVEANRGRMYARDLPDEGCVFTVDLPRLTLPVDATR